MHPTRRATRSFPPSRFTALRRALSAQPDAYAQSRNALDGAVTGLSPYLTHGILGMAELFALWRGRLGLTLADKLCQELTWRAFFLHAWRHLGDGIFDDISPRTADPAIHYVEQLPQDIRLAATGVRVIDESVRQLYATGYLHNHQRLWLASYVVHLRKVHWRVGAEWMYGHLLDGDLASNHLSWQWVAGSFSSKPYLFNAENVARFAPSLASPGTAIDRDYAELEALAGSQQALAPEGVRPLPTREPELLAHPPWQASPEVAQRVRGQRVALVHPWMLDCRPAQDVAIGLIHLPFHTRHPWSVKRWAFVRTRMERICDAIWIGDLCHAQHWLTGAQEVHSRHTLNAEYLDAFGAAGIALQDEVPALPEPGIPCASFSAYFRAVTRLDPSLLESTVAGQVTRLRKERSQGKQ